MLIDRLSHALVYALLAILTGQMLAGWM